MARKRVVVRFDHYESLLIQLAIDNARPTKKDITAEEIVKGVVHLMLEDMYGPEVRAILERSKEDIDKACESQK